MSLLDKASLIVTPNAYKTSKLYSVVPSSGAGDMTVVRATTPATRVNSAGLIETVGLNIPRIDYTNRSCPLILVEPQRTNLVLNSDGNLSTYGANNNVTNATSSFNSFANAIQFPSTGLALAYKSTATTAQTYTISVFIKMDDNSVPILSPNNTTGNLCLVIAGNIATNNLKVESYGNNVYRLSASGIGGTNDNGIIRYATQVLKSFKVTGIQLEAAGYSSSYIPTVASIQTRNADVISKTGISSLINSQAGTMFIEASALANNTTARFIELNNGSTTLTNNVYFRYEPLTNLIAFTVFSSGTLQCNINYSLPLTQIANNKMAFVWALNRFEIWVNGSKVAEDTLGVPPLSSTLSKIIFSDRAEANKFEGNLKSLQIYKEALSNTELAQLTTL